MQGRGNFSVLPPWCKFSLARSGYGYHPYQCWFDFLPSPPSLSTDLSCPNDAVFLPSVYSNSPLLIKIHWRSWLRAVDHHQPACHKPKTPCADAQINAGSRFHVPGSMPKSQLKIQSERTSSAQFGCPGRVSYSFNFFCTRSSACILTDSLSSRTST